jgi:hypothetical protein
VEKVEINQRLPLIIPQEPICYLKYQFLMANFNHKKNPVAKYDINTFQQLLSIIGRYQILR